jgi:putative tricarboxylic transport membrane protein
MNQLIDFLIYIVELLTIENILIFSVFSVLGIIVGALPGLTASMGIAILIGFTFGIDAETSFIMLISVYVGAIFGGSISAILIGIPGTGSAAATVLDGHELTKLGYGEDAIVISTLASMIGTVFGTIVLVIFTPLLLNVALNFSSTEFTLLSIFGITISGSLSSNDSLKGWISGFIGVLIGIIGFDSIYSYPRFTFGIVGLLNGVSLVPAMIGLFGISILIDSLAMGVVDKQVNNSDYKGKKRSGQLFKHMPLIFRSGLIGSFIGSIPGAGEDIAAWLSYAAAKKFSKTPEQFGKGSYEGIIAAETANNSAIGGALIPLLSLGIPGSGPTAVLLGAFALHGIQVGPMILVRSPGFITWISAVLLLAAIFMRLGGYFVGKFATRLFAIPMFILMPIVGVLGVIGSYAIYSNLFDVYIMLIMGLIGFSFIKLDLPAAPAVLGLILSPILDTNLRRALLGSLGSLSPFYTRPISIVLLILIFVSLFSRFLLLNKFVINLKLVLNKRRTKNG